MKLIDHDLHIHTALSSCCLDKENQIPQKIIPAAEKMGLEIIGFSDHCWANPNLTPSDWYKSQDESQVLKLRRSLESIDTDIKVMGGIEGETVAPGKFGLTKGFAQSLDYVLLSCSHFHMDGFVETPSSRDPRIVGKALVRFFESAVNSGLPTSIAHPFMPLGYIDILDGIIGSIPDSTFHDVFIQAAENKVALEITLDYIPGPQDKWSAETPLRFLNLAREAGCQFTLGSDAHTPERFKRVGELSKIIMKLGLTKQNFLL